MYSCALKATKKSSVGNGMAATFSDELVDQNAPSSALGRVLPLRFSATTYFVFGPPPFSIRASDEAHMFPSAANELKVAVLLHTPLTRLQVPKANLYRSVAAE